jgi:DNA-binding LytR/AlgR family response regulator
VGEAQNGEEAIRFIKSLQPQVVFLDIHMPGLNGLEVAQILMELQSSPVVVFVTAYDRYAVQAFDANALDYLLKPFEGPRFKKMCDRVRRVLNNQLEVKEKLNSLKNYLTAEKPLKVTGRSRDSENRVLIYPSDVLYFKQEQEETIVRLMSGDELLVDAALESLPETFYSANFQQVHKDFIVNLDRVEKIIPLSNGDFQLILKDANKTSVTLSRLYAPGVKKFFNS